MWKTASLDPEHLRLGSLESVSHIRQHIQLRPRVTGSVWIRLDNSCVREDKGELKPIGSVCGTTGFNAHEGLRQMRRMKSHTNENRRLSIALWSIISASLLVHVVSLLLGQTVLVDWR